MNEYKPNSHRSKEESKDEKKVRKVTKGKVVTKKKSGVSKIGEALISDDAHNTGNYLLMDVIVPAIKSAIVNVVTDGINMIFFGSTSGRKSNSGPSSFVSYRSYSDRDRRDDRAPSRTRSGYSYDDIIVSTRGEAEEVLSQMENLIDNYGVASVADLYDLVGLTGQYTDNKYGWTNIRSAEPVRVNNGYILKLPKALPID